MRSASMFVAHVNLRIACDGATCASRSTIARQTHLCERFLMRCESKSAGVRLASLIKNRVSIGNPHWRKEARRY